MALYISYNFGASWTEAVKFVAQYDWGPRDKTVIYSAYDKSQATEGHRLVALNHIGMHVLFFGDV